MSALASKRLFLPLLIVLLVALPVIWAMAGSVPVGPSASQILDIQESTLTSYKAAATGVQDISPRVRHRGVGIDGAARSGSTHPMHLAGNPFGSVWSANQSFGGVKLATGAFTQRDVDIALPAEGPQWLIGRSFSNRQEDSGGDHTSLGPQGANWHQTSQPEIVVYWDTAEGTKDVDDVVYLVYGADAFLEFQRFDVTSDEFKGMNGAAGMVEFIDGGGGPDLYVYYDQWGYEFSFFGYDDDAGSAAGQLWKVEDPEGLAAFVGDEDVAADAITLGYASGKVTYAYDSEDRRFTYAYDGNGKISEVKAETKTGGTWSSPTGLAEVAKVTYEYYINADTHGSDNDLKLVEQTVHLSDSGISQTKKKLYRYYGDSAFHDTTHPGHTSEIKMVVDFEGTRNYDYAGDSTFDEDFIAETDANLEPYSAVNLEYNSSGQVDKAFFNGECGCGGGGSNGEHTFEYESNGSYSDGTGYDTAWWKRTVIARPNGSYLTQYFDEVGQSLHQVFTDADPDNTSPVPSRWVTKVTRDSSGIVTDISTPANITGYTHSSASITTSTSAGLAWNYVLQTTGDMTGFLLDTRYKDGTSGTVNYKRSVEHDSASITPATGTDVTIVRPVVDKEKAYCLPARNTCGLKC